MNAIIDGKEYKGAFMYNGEGNFQQNEDGTWSEAVPLPFYGLRKGCYCGKKFWKEENYRTHYLEQHTDGKRYNRTPKGLVIPAPKSKPSGKSKK